MELTNVLNDLIIINNAYGIEDLFISSHPIDIAKALELIEDDMLESFIRLLDNTRLTRIIEEASEEMQQKILRYMGTDAIIQTFSSMSTDDVADIMGLLAIDKRKTLLHLMKSSDSNAIQSILNYGKDTAGGIMTTQYIALSSDLNAIAALNKIKIIGPKTEVIEVIYVINNRDELIGFLDLRIIFNADDKTLLLDIMDQNIIYVEPETDQEEVAFLVSKYDLKALPVVNSKKVIIGIITLDDVIDVIIEEQTEDMLMLSGVDKNERLGSTLGSSIRRRLPWLYINLFTAFLAAFTVALFEDIIAQVVALAAIMPIVAGMGGNAGSQTLSILIRSIALKEIDVRKDWRMVFKEILLGIINGVAIGFVSGIIIFLKYNSIVLGIIIAISMIANLIIAGLFGFLIPVTLKCLKLDPAISSSIFLTTATDIGGFFVFLGMAKIFLPFLV